MAATAEDIRSALVSVGLDRIDPEVLSKCTALAVNQHLTADQMAECWEAFSLNKNIQELTKHTFQAYQASLIKDSDVVMTRPAMGKRQKGPPLVTPQPKRRQAESSNSSSPPSGLKSVAKRVSMSPVQPSTTPSKSYDQRTNVNKVEASFNSDKLDPVTASPAAKCVVSYSYPTNVQSPYRYMFTTMGDRAKALEQQLLAMGEEILQAHGLVDNPNVPDLETVGVPRPDKILCIGRICNEAQEGTLNSASVVLEGSRQESGGQRVPVDLSQLQSSYSLFPGQIVAIEGVNATGRKLVASRIYEGAKPQPVQTPVQELLQFAESPPVKMLSVCGPYTTSDNWNYAPLMDFIHQIMRERPHVVILTGPFVDVKQNGDLLFDSNVALTYEAFFANQVAGLIEEMYSKIDFDCQFVLVPSLDDATAEWVYPQPPFQDRLPNGGKILDIPTGMDASLETGTLGLHHIETAGEDRPKDAPRRVHCVSNPCTLKVNEIVIGVTATDTVFDIRRDEAHANLPQGSLLPRIAQHLLQQQSYYPLFPSPKVNLDLARMDQWKMPCQPDILILPSKLKLPLCTVSDSTLVVNPGTLARGQTGGTYAIVDVYPMKKEKLENAEEESLPHGICDRVRVEVKRI